MSAGEIVVVRLNGELEIGRKDEIRAALQLRGNERGVLVDCSQATYADSTALAELLRFRSDAAGRGIPIAVLLASPQFDRIIEYSGLSQAIPIFHDRAQALSFLAERNAS